MTVTLVQNLPNRAPNALQIRYDFSNGAPAQTWFLPFGAGAALPQDVSQFTCLPVPGVNLVTMQNVAARTLIAHYPVAPIAEQIQVSSVQA